MERSDYLEKAINWAKKKAFVTLKAKKEGFEDPKTFIQQSTQEKVQPDLSFVTKSGAKHYTDIAMKSDKVQKLVTRWKLLSMMASIKDGKLHLLAPKGHKMFTQNLVKQYEIDASIHSLR